MRVRGARQIRTFPGPLSELEDRRRDQVGRGDARWVMQIAGSLQRLLGPSAYRSAGIIRNEIDAQPSDDGASVVFIQTVKGEAVVEQSRRLMEHLASHLEVHLGPCLGDRLCGCPELIERWVDGAGRHCASLSGRSRPSKHDSYLLGSVLRAWLSA